MKQNSTHLSSQLVVASSKPALFSRSSRSTPRRGRWAAALALGCALALSSVTSLHARPAAPRLVESTLTTLGGPQEKPYAPPAKSVPNNSTQPRLAQLDSSNSLGGNATRVPIAGGELSHAESQVTPAQNNLPVDLSIIRRIKVAGRIIPEQPMRVGNLDVLVPIVEELGPLGASASRIAASNVPGNINTPSEDQNFQINLPQGPPIILTVGKAVAYINNVEQPMRAAPLVIQNKIWLPVFSLAPLLGAATRIESDGTLHLNPTVQSVELFQVRGMTVLTIKTSAPLRPDGVLMGTLDNPPKLYLDFSGYSMGFDAAGSTTERVIGGGLNEVTRIRSGLFQKFPDTTRVVLDLRKDMTGVMQPLPDKTIFALILTPPGRTARAVPPANVVDPVIAPSGTGSLRGLTIVVDAGHGGHDNGAMGKRSREKDHALDISRRLANHLRSRGANVLMTRDGDYFVTLQGRAQFANSRKADIFFSVHINSFKSTSQGTETFYNTTHSLMLAREVHKELAKATGLRNRGVSRGPFYVIRKTTMPSILTETAFISNSREEALLMQPQYRERVARGMALGVQNYVDKYMRSSTSG